MSWILSVSDQNVKRAGQLLKSGSLVAIPTETVYGLGANIYSEEALLNVFKFKGRPFSDPLIVHLAKTDQVKEVAALSAQIEPVFQLLAESFWPGPMTIILPSAKSLNPLVNANTGTVAVRIPSHPIARAVLLEAGVPVAAPSANRFGHVSPTLAHHVWDNLSVHEVCILDGGECTLGVESTVIRLEENKVIFLRRGPISMDAVRSCLSKFELSISFHDGTREHQKPLGQKNHTSPGQLLTHYAPEIPCFVLRSLQTDKFVFLNKINKLTGTELTNICFVDFGSKFIKLKDNFGCYFDLSSSGSSTEALFNAFSILRMCEKQNGMKIILLPYFEESKDHKLSALADRFYRASSGKMLDC